MTKNVVVVRARGARGATGQSGIQGIQGLQGRSIQGVQGPAGLAHFDPSFVSFAYEQMTNAKVWNITHNLGFRPNAMVMDYGQNDIECDIEYVDVNEIRLTFSDPVSGYAYLS
jgi:hypothetical protein